MNGERVWFQIGDRLLWDMLVELNFHKPLGLAERALGVAKRVLTRGVTMTPEFQLANIIRDTFNAYTMSRGGQLPVIDAVKAMRDIWAESDAYKLFLANGGGFGNATSDEAKAVKLRIARGNVRAILDTPAKLLDWWDKWGQSFELATRLAEFKRMRAKGASAREAAFQGREISTDFAMRGRSTLMRLAVNSLPFFGARLQGLYRLERELFERSGRQSWTGERALTYATRSLLGITLPSLLLYWANRDDEDYEALPEEIKNLYWCWKIPGTHDFALIPKPFETGAVFSTVPERLWEHVEKRNDRKLADAAKFMLMNTFAFDPEPQLVKPLIDVYWKNQRWNGMPIVPQSLQNVEPQEQYGPWTAKSMIEIGKAFDVSPMRLEALVNGYLGTLGQWSLMGADALVTADDTGPDPAKRLSQYPVLRRFLREQPYSNTSYESDFYRLLGEAAVTVNTARKLRREARAEDLAAYLGQSEQEQLFAIGAVTQRVADRARDIQAAMRAIRRDPGLSSEQKRRQMDPLQAEQNRLFREVVGMIGVDGLKKYRDALEGVSTGSATNGKTRHDDE